MRSVIDNSRCARNLSTRRPHEPRPSQFFANRRLRGRSLQLAATRSPAGLGAAAVTAITSSGAGLLRRVVARPRGGELDVLGAVDVERDVDDLAGRVDHGLVARGA